MRGQFHRSLPLFFAVRWQQSRPSAINSDRSQHLLCQRYLTDMEVVTGASYSDMSLYPVGLKEWIARALQCAVSEMNIELIAGDASPRQYYRVTSLKGLATPNMGGATREMPSLIAMVSPASQNNEAFLRVGAQMAKAGVRTPAVFAQSLRRGWLLEDFGDQQLLPALASYPESAAALYQKAFNALMCQISMPCEEVGIPGYDSGRLKTEMDVFPEWFLSGLLGIQPDERLRQCYAMLTDYLISVFAEQPTVWVHRDFHSRNLMLLEGSELGVIDFQDAVLGPITYDPVSLLKDCYIRWPRSQQLAWLDSYLLQLRSVGVAAPSAEQASSLQALATRLKEVSPAQFQSWFDLTGLQRHLRVLGVFARLHLRDQKSTYLADLPLVAEYVREALALTAGAHSSVTEFRDWFESDLMSVISEQPWYEAIDPEGWVR
jgi:aminoglycoside/choline kinase family phosphotransferase